MKILPLSIKVVVSVAILGGRPVRRGKPLRTFPPELPQPRTKRPSARRGALSPETVLDHPSITLARQPVSRSGGLEPRPPATDPAAPIRHQQQRSAGTSSVGAVNTLTTTGAPPLVLSFDVFRRDERPSRSSIDKWRCRLGRKSGPALRTTYTCAARRTSPS